MQPFTIADSGFNGMAEGMAKVEEGALAGLALISNNDFALVPARTADRWYPRSCRRW